MTAIFNGLIEWSHIRNRYINIIRKECTVKHGSLSTFADTCSQPLPFVDVFQGCHNLVNIIKGVFYCEIIPITRLRYRLSKVSVFTYDHIRIK